MRLQLSFAALFFVFFIHTAPAQWLTRPNAAGNYNVFYLSENFDDAFASKVNPAAHALLGQSAAGVLGERKFMLEDLNMVQASGNLHTLSGGFGAYLNYFGSHLQNQMQATLSYGRMVTEGFAVGGSFHFHQLNQSGVYGNASALTGSIGFAARLPANMRLGMVAYNPVRARWGKSEEDRIPASYSFGIGSDLSKQVFLGACLVSEEGQPIDVQVAVHYQFLDAFFARGGITTVNGAYFAALGWQMPAFRLDLATGFHPQLGWTPGLALLFQFPQPNSKVD